MKPQLIKKIFTILSVLLLASLCVIVFLSFKDNQSVFVIKKIVLAVEGENRETQYIKNKIIKLQMQLEPYQGQSIWDLNLGKVTDEIVANNWVENVTIVRKWPSELKVIVLPKWIGAVYLKNSGKLNPVAQDGQLLDEIAVSEALDVPILRGDEFLTDQQLRKQVIDLLAELPKTGKLSLESVSEIAYEVDKGFWLSLNENGVKVGIGGEDIAKKATRVSKVLEYMNRQNLEGRVIDARFSKKVLVKLRKEP